MQTVWGLIVAGLAQLCWGGQTISWFAPNVAAGVGLTESEGEVDPVY
ncbi:MAG: hypothetical protein OEV40_28490 [Acidimicrobiia bacterium]|nr:hypothetical protein [Acidimicrobiia bacterium]